MVKVTDLKVFWVHNSITDNFTGKSDLFSLSTVSEFFLFLFIHVRLVCLSAELNAWRTSNWVGNRILIMALPLSFFDWHKFNQGFEWKATLTVCMIENTITIYMPSLWFLPERMKWERIESRRQGTSVPGSQPGFYNSKPFMCFSICPSAACLQHDSYF